MTRHASRLLAAVALLAVGVPPARAAVLVWTGTGTSWSSAASWNPAAVPAAGDDLVYGAAGGGDSFANISGLGVRSLRFAHAPLPLHKIHVTGTLNFSGPGIFNDSIFVSGVGRQQFFADSGAAIVFQNAATIGGTTGPVDLNVLNGGVVRFEGNSSASSTTDFLLTGLIVEGGGELRFRDDAWTGYSAFINNKGGDLAGAAGGVVIFEARAIAAHRINNDTSGGLGGRIFFRGTARAQDGTALQNHAATVGVADAEAVTQFLDDARLDAFVENFQSNLAGAPGGRLELRQRASAAGSFIANRGSGTADAEGGRLQFFDQTTAGDAAINNQTEGEPGDTRLNGGVTEFFDDATAGTATITNAGEATANGTGGRTLFRGASHAQSATITNEGGRNDARAPGGLTEFSGNASAGSATLQANGGESTGAGGLVVFREASTGGTARVVLHAGATQPGTLDVSQLTTAGTMVGSIEGGGVIALGAMTLTVSGNGLGTTFSGVIKDGGLGGGTGGSLTKTGAGTLTLSGTSTYTGATAVSTGKLLVNGSLANSPVSVASGATLGGTGTLAGAVTVADGGTLAAGPASGAGTLTVASLGLNASSNLAFDFGAPGAAGNDRLDVSGNLTLDGVINLSDLGGFGLGIYRLFNYTGTLTDNGLTIGTLPPGVTAGGVSVQTSVPGQVNLVVVTGLAAGYWDGPNTTANNVVDGGTGNWNASALNWTNATGSANGLWGGQFAIFSGAAGTVTLTESVATTGAQFSTDGYVINATGAAALALTGLTSFRVDPSRSATINAPLTGTGWFVKNDSGTLTLAGANSSTSGTSVLDGVLIVRDAAGNGLGAGPVFALPTPTEDLRFEGNASAGAVAITNRGSATSSAVATTTFIDTATAGTATITNEALTSVTGLGARTRFLGHASGGSATFVNLGAGFSRAETVLMAGETQFHDDSTADAAEIANYGGAVAFGEGGKARFFNQSSAGRAFIDNFSGSTTGAFGGAVIFRDTASATDAIIWNRGGGAVGIRGGATEWGHASTASNASLRAFGAMAVFALGGRLSFLDDSTAGNASILVDGAGGVQTGAVRGGTLEFQQNARAGTATIILRGGANALNDGGSVDFYQTSSAQNASFTVKASEVATASGGLLQFWETSNGGAANIVNEGSALANHIGGTTAFRGSATADRGTFFNQSGRVANAHGGRTYFYDSATAGTGRFTSEGAAAANGYGGVIRFFNQSSADFATITNNGTAVAGANEGGVLYFNDTSSAGRATIANLPGAAKSGGTAFFFQSTAGHATIVNHGAAANAIESGATHLADAANAGSATITNEASAAIDRDGCLISFINSATAGNATIINEGAPVGGGKGGITRFAGAATAANAAIVARRTASTTGFAFQSYVSFEDAATAGNATLTAEGGAGGFPGLIYFFDTADGGTARVILQAGVAYQGTLDISPIASPGVSVGSIEGGGEVLLGLGAKRLTVGTNNLSTTFSGRILGNGGLVKNGTGTLTLSGANPYTGPTLVNSGTLAVNGSIAGGVVVRAGGTLKGTGTIGGPVIVLPGGIFAPGTSPGTITVGGLEFGDTSVLDFELGTTSDQAAIHGDLILDGVLNITNAGGLTVSGPFELFRWTGTLTNHGLTIGTVPAGFSASDFSFDFANGVARLVVEPNAGPPPPLINTQAANASAYHGATAQFTAAAGGATGLSYRWQGRPVSGTTWTDLLDGGAFTGATTATLSVSSAVAMNGDRFRVVVNSDNGGSVASAAVTLTVTYAPRLLNLSTRGLAQTGDNVLIPGFVISGTANKQLLIRAVGPSLGKPPFDLAGTLANPRMTLKRLQGGAYVDVAANDDWQTNTNATDIATTAAQLFAFEFKDSREAALLVDLAPGQYTVVADDATGATGLAIVELYDADAASTDSRLINISNRGFAGVGDQVMIPGFVISPEGPKTVLVRVVGPTLDSYNVPGTMADPKLTIYSGSTPILANDNWSDNSDAAYTAQVAAQVFAFPLSSGSKDAAFVVTLPPGVYTVVGSSAIAGGTGVVLVEVYVVP